MRTLSANASRSQQFQTQSKPSSSPLESLIADLGVLRDVTERHP